MRDLMDRIVDANRRKYAAWCALVGEPAPGADPVLYPALGAAGLAELAEAAGGELPEDLVTLLSAPEVRFGVSVNSGVRFGDDDEHGHMFAWLDNPAILRETRGLRAAAEEYDWDVPPCVVLSAESSEVIACRLDGGIIHVSAGDDGEVTGLEVDLAGLLQRYLEAVERDLAAD